METKVEPTQKELRALYERLAKELGDWSSSGVHIKSVEEKMSFGWGRSSVDILGIQICFVDPRDYRTTFKRVVFKGKTLEQIETQVREKHADLAKQFDRVKAAKDEACQHRNNAEQLIRKITGGRADRIGQSNAEFSVSIPITEEALQLYKEFKDKLQALENGDRP